MNAKKKGSPKSPRAPSFSLDVSFSDAQRVYDKYGHGVVSTPEVAAALGMSAKSSSLRRRIFTLKEFGLLDSADSDFKVSPLFLEMKSAVPNSPQFKGHAVTAIEGSSLFAELLREFNGKLPPRDAVAVRLETQRRFSADRAREVADTLERSLRFAGVLDAGGNILPVREEPLDETHPERQAPADQQGVTAQGLKVEIALDSGRTVTVFYPADLTSDDAAKISKVVSALIS